LTEHFIQRIDKPVLALVGPTAIGKTALSLELSQQFNCEIISVDSMQVYRYMDIGTAKAGKEEQQLVPHHLIDIVDPDEDYNAARFVKDCLAAIELIHAHDSIPLLTGGTGLYFQALKQGLFQIPAADPQIRHALKQRLQEEGSSSLHQELLVYDPQSAKRIHENDSSRIIRALEVFLSTDVPMSDHLKQQIADGNDVKFSNFISIGLTCDRDLLYQRINLRTAQLFELGLESEVMGLLDRGFGPELKTMQSIGYRHMIHYIHGDWTLDQCSENLARDTRRYAKRQFTWFNNDNSINWFDKTDSDQILSYIEQELEKFFL